MVESTGSEIQQDERELIQNDNEETQNNSGKKNRPTPETVAMDRGVQNIARKAHKNSKGDDKKLGETKVSLTTLTIKLIVFVGTLFFPRPNIVVESLNFLSFCRHVFCPSQDS